MVLWPAWMILAFLVGGLLGAAVIILVDNSIDYWLKKRRKT